MSRASPAAPPAPASEASEVFYPVKWVLDHTNNSVPICMQARNGPCALLALVNINLQANAFTLQPGTVRMREDHLMAILADFVSTRPSTAQHASEDVLRQHAVADFLDLLPRLNRGMHINVRFNAPTSFEFTRELGVFDIFPAVTLLHGWLVDPQDRRLASALGTLSYNQVIDELVRTATPLSDSLTETQYVSHTHQQHQQQQQQQQQQEQQQQQQDEEEANALVHTPSAPPIEAFDLFAHDDPDRSSPTESSATDFSPDEIPNTGPLSISQPLPLPQEESQRTLAIREVRPIVMDFLESNPTQLTVYGLTELHAALAEGERAILFRNSHFYVILKHGGELFTLVTDVGYLNELNTVWEKLSDINGDSTFYNGSFQRLSPTGEVAEAAQPQTPPSPPPPTIGQRPQQQVPSRPQQQRSFQPPTVPPTNISANSPDIAVNPSQGTQQQTQPRPVRPLGSHGRKSEKCVVQ